MPNSDLLWVSLKVLNWVQGLRCWERKAVRLAWPFVRITAQTRPGCFLGICSRKSYSESENSQKIHKKPHHWSHFPEALLHGGGRGRDSCPSNYQKGLLQKENYSDKARKSERLRSAAVQKTAEKKTKQQNKKKYWSVVQGTVNHVKPGSPGQGRAGAVPSCAGSTAPCECSRRRRAGKNLQPPPGTFIRGIHPDEHQRVTATATKKKKK